MTTTSRFIKSLTGAAFWYLLFAVPFWGLSITKPEIFRFGSDVNSVAFFVGVTGFFVGAWLGATIAALVREAEQVEGRK